MSRQILAYLPPLGECDVHARLDAGRTVYLAVYCRQQQRWYSSTDAEPSPVILAAALDAIEARS